jgi:radical SAM-linked protein
VVIPPPPIPIQLPQRAPASERVCRLRIGFAKSGSLALISHLDTLRLLERALRRSALPVSFTGGFHPLPRLQLALPLPLGVEGLGEWLDLEFVELVDPAAVRARLQVELPQEFQLLSAESVEVFGPSLSQQLVAARWQIQLTPATDPILPSLEQWQQAVAAVLAAPSLIWQDTDKKGRPRQRDCREALLGLGLTLEPGGSVMLELDAAIDPSGRSLRPEQLQHWLAEQLDRPLHLGRLQRQALTLKPVLV